ERRRLTDRCRSDARARRAGLHPEGPRAPRPRDEDRLCARPRRQTVSMLGTGSMSMATDTGSHGGADETRAYYNEFSKSYERHRRPNDAGGYHALVDDLEVE